jgi:HSP20 family protein
MFEEHFRDFEPPRPSEGGKPLVYGFSMRVDEDGKPVISEFGNTARQGKQQNAREPLVDLINGERDITVVAELPGVEKKNLQLKVSKNALNIDVTDPERRFAKSVRLPTEVDEKASKASLKNGILEVVLKKRVASKQQHSGESIKVE